MIREYAGLAFNCCPVAKFNLKLYKMSSYKKFADPYRTEARFNSKCSVCEKPIKKGDSIVYDKMRRLVYCADCGASIIRGVQAEKSMDQYGTDIY